MLEILKQFYEANSAAINMLLVGLGVAIIDLIIEKSKHSANSVFSLVGKLLVAVKDFLVKKKS